MQKRILYLHGFASSPRGRKIAALRELLPAEEFRVVAPDLNVPSFERLDFATMVRVALFEARVHEPAVVVGSSLGALVALEASRRGVAAPLVLVAPALGFGARWTEKLPADPVLSFFHHGEERDLPIHRRFFEQLAGLETDRQPPPRPVTIVMGRRDESVPFDLVREVWQRWEGSGALPPGSRFVEIPEGDHGLLQHAPRIAEEVRRAAEAGG